MQVHYLLSVFSTDPPVLRAVAVANNSTDRDCCFSKATALKTVAVADFDCSARQERVATGRERAATGHSYGA